MDGNLAISRSLNEHNDCNYIDSKSMIITLIR